MFWPLAILAVACAIVWMRKRNAQPVARRDDGNPNDSGGWAGDDANSLSNQSVDYGDGGRGDDQGDTDGGGSDSSDSGDSGGGDGD